VPLTVKDILEKTFKRSFKGYDEDEVDKFLDQIIDEFKELQNENAVMKNELTTLREQARKVKEAEDTIMNTLVSAQRSAERIINDASRKAELVISSAEATARRRADEATQELKDSEAKLEELKGCAQGFATSFANMVNAQAAHFEKTFRSYFGQEETSYGGGINTEALSRIDKDIAQSLKELPDIRLPEATAAPASAPERAEADRVSETQPPVGPAEAAPETAADSDGFMELFEINKMLGELESGVFAPAMGADKPEELPAELPAEKPEEPADAAKAVPKSIGDYKPKYDDYSWIYENGEKADDFSLSFKDPKEKEDLKSLIDEIID
jgi:cell division initiation protein